MTQYASRKVNRYMTSSQVRGAERGRAGPSWNWNGFIFYGHNSDDLDGLWSSVALQNGNGNPLKYPPLRVD
jgi:hypothetical protein